MGAVVNDRILDRVLGPVGQCLTPAVASRIAALRADPQLQQRLDELAEKNSEATLTPREEAEYEAYVEALDLIAILQATARKALKAARRTARR
jgi:predicted transcriptional regulator